MRTSRQEREPRVKNGGAASVTCDLVGGSAVEVDSLQ
jgi:hypothetical protein